MAGTHTTATLVLGPLRVAGATAPTYGPRKSTLSAFTLGNRWYGGKGVITGTVKVKGSPDYAVARPVRLLRDRDAVCVGEVWSHPTTGAYQFVDLAPNERYTAMAIDYTENFRVAAADNLPVD